MTKILEVVLLLQLLLGCAYLGNVSAADGEVDMNSVKSSLKDIQGEIVEMEWCGTDEIFSDETDKVNVAEDIEDSFDTRLFVLTTLGKVLKSSNYGKSWVQISKEDFFATEISISPVDGKTVYLWGQNESSYVSEQCGKTWKKLTHPPGLFDFRFHRTNKDWILAHQQQICNQNSDEHCNESTQKVLYASKDAGKSFQLLAVHVLEATWNRMNNFYNVKTPGIIAAIEEKDGPRIVYSDDFWQTLQTVQFGGDNFFQAEFFLFVTIKPTDSEKNYELRIATLFDDFKSYLDMKQIQLPFEANDHLSFTILRSDGPKVFITVVHENEGLLKQSNVYVSDWRGYELSLSLLNNVRSANGDCDFEKVESNEGVYIANVYDSEKVHGLKMAGKQGNHLQTLSAYKKTVISYDNGANWHPIKAPALKSTGKNYHCSGDCSLHLVGRTSNLKGYMYSSGNAPGIIVALGNVGTHLATKNHELNTYVSSDGGHTWMEILQGPHVFEIGDHGGIIVAAAAFNKTNIIKYSWDEGRTWGSHKITGGAFDINAISTEPNNMEQRFVISGTRSSSNAEGATATTVIGLIDLSELHTRGCVGSEHPDRPNSDYEEWIPTNFQGEQCVFGKKYKYVRRKPTAKCYNSINVEQKKLAEECPCSEEDWECDFGFYRKNNDGPCIPRSDKFSQENLEKPPTDCNYSYTISKGYRKIPGMYCIGGVDKGAEIRFCPQKITETRAEEQTEDYNNYKEQQEILKHIIEAERQKVLQKQIERQQLLNKGTNIIGSVLIALISAIVIGIVVCFREPLRNIVSAIKDIGFRRQQQQTRYSSLSSKKMTDGQKKSAANQLFGKSKLPLDDDQEKGIKIEAEEPVYDMEDPDLDHEEKPVLLRDQENFDDF